MGVVAPGEKKKSLKEQYFPTHLQNHCLYLETEVYDWER